MKKTILIAAAALLLGTVGASFAQTTSIATTNGANQTASVQHNVLVHIPKVVMLRLNGTAPYDVSFTPTLAQIRSVATAGGIALQPDSNTTFDSLQGFTNSQSDVTVNVAFTASGSNPSSDVDGELYLGTTQLSATSTLTLQGTSSNGAPAWQDLISGSTEFSFHYTGLEHSGDYTYTVMYSATVP